MKKFLSIIVFVFYTLYQSICFADANSFDHSHKLWTSTLKNHLTFIGNTSKFDYVKLNKNSNDLKTYLKSLESIPPKVFQTFTESQKLAFYINAYNAFTIQLIIENYPVKSIKDIGSIFSSPWKKKFINLLNEKISLDQLEHERIRNNFKEPRIHFALVCASKGCPALLNEAYVDSKLNQQLEYSTKLFLTDTTRNRFNQEKNKLEISPIFKWYKEDFNKDSQNVKEFVANRISSDPIIQDLIRNDKTKIIFTEYDWSLNE